MKKLLSIQGFKNETISETRFSKSIILGITLLIFGKNVVNAQLTATGQVRTRTEARGGQGTLLSDGQKGALFTSQRTRLNVGFTGYRYKIYTSLQDVRVWGQDASTINRYTVDANDGLMLHEAWGEIMLLDTTSTVQNFSLKFGRQEIVYDDQKVLGSLDWLQQARRHDAIVLKYANKGWTADFGAAFNQRTEQNSGTTYNGFPGTYPAGTNGIQHAYKSFQYAYIGKKFFFGDLSFLFFKDDFAKYTTVNKPGTPPVTIPGPPSVTIPGTPSTIETTFTQGVNSRTTTGFYYNVNPTRKINLNGSVYYQGGHDKTGKTIDAKLFSLTASYQVGRKLNLGAGADYLSGNDGTKGAGQNNQFDPLYGTPHKFWGYMDFFYVASPFGTNGLFNYYAKAKYAASDKLTINLDIHGFQSAAKIKGGKDQYLGTEIDLKAVYKFTKLINMEFGYSLMDAKNTFASLKGVTNPKLTAQWAYFMLNITPNFLNTKKM